jgi:hypothetical protein
MNTPNKRREAALQAEARYKALLSSVDVWDLYQVAPAWYVLGDARDALASIDLAVERSPLAPEADPAITAETARIRGRMLEIIGACEREGEKAARPSSLYRKEPKFGESFFPAFGVSVTNWTIPADFVPRSGGCLQRRGTGVLRTTQHNQNVK